MGEGPSHLRCDDSPSPRSTAACKRSLQGSHSRAVRGPEPWSLLECHLKSVLRCFSP